MVSINIILRSSWNNLRKTNYEGIEDIEILRFHEMNIPVRMLELEGSPLSWIHHTIWNHLQLIQKDYDARVRITGRVKREQVIEDQYCAVVEMKDK